MTTVNPPKLGRYELVDELGKGAMGVVYLARDPIIGRLVALKTFRTNFAFDREEVEQFRQRFLREAQSAGILSHANIVTIHDVVEESAEGVTFIAMEYVRGVDLKEMLRRGDPFTHDRVADIVEGVGEALDYAHAQGVVHRDVKPANVMLTDDGRVKITDFGIARVNASNLTQEGQLLGTPNYMAPEQVLGREVDHRVDVFSLGVVLYELLTRHKPFHGENLTVVSHRIAFDRFTPPRDLGVKLTPEIEAVLERALAKQPADRFQSAGDLARELRVAVALGKLDPGPRLVEVEPPPPRTTGQARAAEPGPARTAILAPAEALAAARAEAAEPEAASPPETVTTTEPFSSLPRTEEFAVETRDADPVSWGADAAVSDAAEDSRAVQSVVEQPAVVDTPDDTSADSSDDDPAQPVELAVAPDAAPPAMPAVPVTPPVARTRRAIQPLRTAILAVAAVALLVSVLAVAWPDAAPLSPLPPEHDLRVKVWAQVRRADELLRAGDPLAAVTVLRAGERLMPGRPGLASRRAEAERQALARASTVEIDLQVEHAVARGQEALAAGRLDDAEAAVQQALALRPDSVEARELAVAIESRRARRPRAEPLPPPVASTVPAAAEPATPTVPAAEPVLVIDFFTELPQGTLAVYVGEEQILNERFRFVRKTGVFRSEPAAGKVEARRTLAAGSVTLRLYVTVPGAAARVMSLDGNFPAGAVRTLRARLFADGSLDASLE